MCCPRFPALPVGQVWRWVPVGTPASRAPAHPRRRGLARARGSGCSVAALRSHHPLAGGARHWRIRGRSRCFYFARLRRLRGHAPAWAGTFPLRCAPAQGAHIIAHPVGARWGSGACRRSGGHTLAPARACGSVLGWASPPPAPLPGGAARPSGRRFSVLRTVAGTSTRCYAIVRHRPPPNYATFRRWPQFCIFSSLFHNMGVNISQEKKNQKKKGGRLFEPPRPFFDDIIKKSPVKRGYM